ncbi:putative TnpX site-specific recombinase [[Clostridium] methylpentosum DSM 5476]|uniref:Putative TnpX site-specific recombinase n=1 Tax=[Clostridium] methylpentosum DSM 5476 TaxID=537013 RepID=C0EEU3_9FIRM|nr:putative TnpX site-specific recombinase [[Clostridium] methylpentosum DSM 5476]
MDEESAKVVRRIFDLCIAGKGPMQIAKILTADKVLTVTAYNARQKGWAMPDNLYQWCAKSVAGILERQEYTGCTVNFKTYTKSLKFKKRMENPKENRRIFEDTQPAIIEWGQWERVQALRANKRRPTKTGKTSIFSGLVYCADCGAKLYYCTCSTYRDDSQDHFVCSNYKSNTGSCKIHYIREVTLYKRVLECIQGALTYVRLFRDDFTQEMLAQDEASRKAELAQKRKALSGAQKRMEDLDKIIQRLYEDSVLGKLSDLRFQKLSAQYETERAEIQCPAISLEREIENEAGQIADVGRFLQLADRYSDLQELDASTVNELIDRIVIHSPEKIGGKKHVTIEIYFTYVGKIRIPLAKPELLTDKEKPA